MWREKVQRMKTRNEEENEKYEEAGLLEAAWGTPCRF